MSGHEQWPWLCGPKEAGIQCEALNSPFPWMVPLLEAKWAYNYHITPQLGEGLSASAQATSNTAVAQALEKWLVTPAKAEMTGLDRILLSQGPGRSGSVLPQRPLCLNSVNRGPGLYVSMSSKRNLDLRSLPDVQETTLSVSAWPGARMGNYPFHSAVSPINQVSEWVKSLSHVQLFTTPWTVAFQAPPSMVFSRQEYWSGLPFPSVKQESSLIEHSPWDAGSVLSVL